MDTRKDADIVALLEMTIAGPGPGTLSIKFSRSELYAEPWIVFTWYWRGGSVRYRMEDGVLTRYTKFSEYFDEMNQNADLEDWIIKWKKEVPENAPLTEEQYNWLAAIKVDKINQKFRDMETVIELENFQ